jgi:hypothetical protein
MFSEKSVHCPKKETFKKTIPPTRTVTLKKNLRVSKKKGIIKNK